jgi:hypothetical protein
MPCRNGLVYKTLFFVFFCDKITFSLRKAAMETQETQPEAPEEYRGQLCASASSLTPPGPEAVAEFTAQEKNMVAELNMMLRDRDDIVDLIGLDNIPMMEQNHRNHALFMRMLLADYSADRLVETVVWVLRTYRDKGFRMAYWPAQLDCWRTVLARNLSEAACREIMPFYEWMLASIPLLKKLSDEGVSLD